MTSATQGTQIVAWDEWRRYGINMPACVLGMMMVAMHGYSLGVMIGPLEAEFHWTRSQISAGPLITSIGTLLLAPVAGRALDRYGPRRIALIGVPAYCIAFALIATAGPSIWSWLALFALLAFALILIFPTVWTAAVAIRFAKNRGLALAIALSGTGITSAFVPYLASLLLEAHGWRGAYIGLALATFVIVFPLVIFTFDRDDTHRRLRESMPVQEQEATALGLYLAPRYLMLAGAMLIYTLGSTGLAINAVPILVEEGFELVDAAKIVGLIGIGTIIGRIVGGFLLDRMDGRLVAVGCGMAGIACAVILLLTDQSPQAASLACLFLGLAAGAEYDACAYLCTRYFSRSHFGALFGLIGALAGLGAGVSPMIANAIYDVTGTYETVLWCIVPIFLVASVLFLALGPYPPEEDKL
ncbi:MAG: MFS transporter [Sphingomonadaceae bacterium]